MEFDDKAIKDDITNLEKVKDAISPIKNSVANAKPIDGDEIFVSKENDASKFDSLKKSINGSIDVLNEFVESASNAESANEALADSLGAMLGSTYEMNDGIIYGENVWGTGKTGKIGENSPSGTYMVNRVAIVDPETGKLIANLGLDDHPDSKGKKIDEIVDEFAESNNIKDKDKLQVYCHIGLVDGDSSLDRGWIQEDILPKPESSKQSESNSVSDVELGEQVSGFDAEKFIKEMSPKIANALNFGGIGKEFDGAVTVNGEVVSPAKEKDESVKKVDVKTPSESSVGNKSYTGTLTLEDIGKNNSELRSILDDAGVTDSDLKDAHPIYDEHHKLRTVTLDNGLMIGYKESGSGDDKEYEASYGLIYDDKYNNSGNDDGKKMIICTEDVNLLRNAVNTRSQDSDEDLSDYNVSNIRYVGDITDEGFEGRTINFDGQAKLQKVNVKDNDFIMVRGIGSEGECKLGYVLDENGDMATRCFSK